MSHVSFTIPEPLEAALRRRGRSDLNQAAKEALVAELYREGEITLGQVAAALGLSLNDAAGFLEGRQITLNYSIQDLEADQEAVTRLLG